MKTPSWVISELEDDKTPPEYTVSAVPTDWIKILGGKEYCLWPNTNPGPKIRLCEEPTSDWKLYKCRLLMNGGMNCLSKRYFEKIVSV